MQSFKSTSDDNLYNLINQRTTRYLCTCMNPQILFRGSFFFLSSMHKTWLTLNVSWEGGRLCRYYSLKYVRVALLGHGTVLECPDW